MDKAGLDPNSVRAAWRAEANALGFDAFGIAAIPSSWAPAERLKAFIALDRHGQMSWMQTTLDRRVHPKAMWPDARTAIVLGCNYGPETDPLTALEDHSRGAISVYAQGADYHDVIKSKLKAFARWIVANQPCELKVFVDTAPLMEKPLAALAGLGWQGKHTNLVSREFGSWLFLGVILTSLTLSPDAPALNHCGACRACLDICPTNAFPAPYQLDARACISYLTIEHRGPVDPKYRSAMGNRIYGCDDCLAVCPWNKFAQRAAEHAFHQRPQLGRNGLAELAGLDDAAFRALFAGSPIKRIGRDRFVRNVLYAIGNSGDPALVNAARACLDDDDVAVRDAAEWALSRLEGPATALRA
jgi:epoxyqueuosine reductase